MKKQLLFSSLLGTIVMFSQAPASFQPAYNSSFRYIADQKYSDTGVTHSKIYPSKTTVQQSHKALSTNTLMNWQSFTGSMNIWGVIVSSCKPLQWNDELNAVSFIHRKAEGYLISPLPSANAENGAMVAHVTLDCGGHWDSTALFSNDNFWGRFPGGAIYNPPSTPANTNISNAYVVGSGPVTGVAGGWTGNFYASKKLGPANYNNAPSTVANAVQVMPYGLSFPPNIPSRHDFATYNFTATDDGKMRVLAGVNGLWSDTAVMLMTGAFNNGVFDWSGKVFSPPVTGASNGAYNIDAPFLMAWNELGTVGYVVIIGSRSGATLSNVGMQPIVYKTTNSGSTWSLENGINFNSSAYADVRDRLAPVNSNSALKIPHFTWLEGMDCSVDATNKLHIFTTLLGHVSNNFDSLRTLNHYTSEGYLWPHTPGRKPYLFDFIYDGTNSNPGWTHLLIDSMPTEGPGGVVFEAGFNDNPWDMDPYQAKIKLDARIQMSRTPDGKQLLYCWTESDTSYTTNQKKWNNLPNLKARLFDVEQGALSPVKVDLTTASFGEISNRAMFYYVSPKFKLISKTPTTITVMAPMTISNSTPYAQLSANTHWFSCSPLSFANPSTDVGVAEVTGENAYESFIFPNPAKNALTVKIYVAGTSDLNVEIRNALGQVVRTKLLQGQTGATAINLDLSGLSGGIYFVSTRVNTHVSTKKLIIE